MRPHWTPRSDSFTSPPTPTMKPIITTPRHAMVRELTLAPSITTLNMALKTIVSDLRMEVGGGRSGGYARISLPCCYATHWQETVRGAAFNFPNVCAWYSSAGHGSRAGSGLGLLSTGCLLFNSTKPGVWWDDVRDVRRLRYAQQEEGRCGWCGCHNDYNIHAAGGGRLRQRCWIRNDAYW